MKKALLLLSFWAFLVTSFSSAVVLDDAIVWAYTKKLTIHLNTSDFNPYQAIRRDEAAKFFVNFAKLVGKTEYVVNAEQCQFSDLHKAWSDLKDMVVESCRLGIFNGNKGKFNPDGMLTNAQAVAVLMRIVDGYQTESWLSHRAEKYYERANALKLIANVEMNEKSGLADRGNVVTILYNARKMQGSNARPPQPETPPSSNTSLTSTNTPITIINHNASLQGNELSFSYALQEVVEKEIKSLMSSALLDTRDLSMFEGKIALRYTQGCTTFWSGNTQVMTMTYGDTSTTSLQSLDLYFSLCNDTKLKGVWENALNSYAKRLTLHELGHYLYWVKDTTFEAFEAICWKGGEKSCTADDFISEYAQTDKYEDYAESFAYRYLANVQKEEPLRKPDTPNAVKFQAKMQYFDRVFPPK